MDLVIIANFCGDLTSGQGNNRFLYLAALLAAEHDVELVTSDFDHSAKTHRAATAEFPFRLTQLHEPGYPKNICLRRLVSHRIWGKNVAAYLAARKAPDVVYCAVPSLSAPAAAADHCRKRRLPFIVDVQDLWPEAFGMVVHPPVAGSIAFAPFHARANKIYRQADGIAAVSETYCRRVLAVNRKCKEAHPVFPGTRLADFDALAAANPVKDKPENQLWLGYCGTLGSSYDLDMVLDALRLLKARGVTPPRFIVMGGGPRRAAFERHARESGADALFTGLLPYGEMCGLLCACDIVINPITEKSAASIINKHADYAACGLPVVNTQESPEYQALVERYAMGVNCPGKAGAVADALERLIKDESLRREMGRHARRCAEELFDRETSYQELAELISGCAKARRQNQEETL